MQKGLFFYLGPCPKAVMFTLVFSEASRDTVLPAVLHMQTFQAVYQCSWAYCWHKNGKNRTWGMNSWYEHRRVLSLSLHSVETKDALCITASRLRI